MSGHFETLLAAVDRREPVVLVVVVSPAEQAGTRLVLGEQGALSGTLPGGPVGEWLAESARQALRERRPITLEGHGLEVYFEPYPPRPELIIVGGGHVGKALYDLAAPLPIFDITVIDDRPTYSNPTRFPLARPVCCDFAKTFETVAVDPDTFIVIVTRGHRADRTCLQQALATPAKYIGMIGSKRKVLMTYKHLREDGITTEQLHRVHAPVGLALGATGAAEIAVAILAELVAVKNGREPKAIAGMAMSVEMGR